MPRSAACTYRTGGSVLLRATSHPRPGRPHRWPDLTADSDRDGEWKHWLEQMWSDPVVVGALTHASTDLADQVDAILNSDRPVSDRRLCQAVMPVMRYLLRWQGRATPFGVFAGVAAGTFSGRAAWRWGSGHVAVARAAPEWVEDVITGLEGRAYLLNRLPVVANTAATVRADRLLIPYRPGRDGPVDVSMAYTEPVRAAMLHAAVPIVFEELAVRLQEDFAAEEAPVTQMLTGLVAHGALISSLRAPMTEPDALAHLLEQLGHADAADVPETAPILGELRRIHAALDGHNQAPAAKTSTSRNQITAMMRALAPAAAHQVAVDLRLDAEAALPHQVGREIEQAAAAMVRLSPLPFGPRSWRDYVEQFWNRYGTGALVPVADVVAELGFPDGYFNELRQSPTVSERDRLLVELAQSAILDGLREVVIDEGLLARLGTDATKGMLPPHLDVAFRLHARSLAALDAGRFRAEITTLSRSGGVLIGRFLPVLDAADSARLTADLADLPGADEGTAVAQMSFAPLHPEGGHLARTRRVLPLLISLAEHRPPSPDVLTVADLAVGCDGHRLYLAAPSRGVRVDAVQIHALNARLHTPPLARLLIELTRAPHPHVFTGVGWGGAAERLPFRPALRYGRVTLSPATWRLDSRLLPGRSEPWRAWDGALKTLRKRRGLPGRLHLVEGDRLLPLDLDEPSHRVLLRSHLDRNGTAALAEAPGPDALGWCGGRPHELITTLTTARPPLSAGPPPTPARLVRRGHGDAPGTCDLVFAKLGCPPEHQDSVLAEHLPDLLARLDGPNWWFLRFTDAQGAHLRLRISLPGGPDAERFGRTCQSITAWAQRLQAAGLAGPVSYATSFPEVGRWGSGEAYARAAAVFGADSRAVLAQLRHPARLEPAVLAAVNMVAIAVAFTGGIPAGMSWLIDHLPASAPSPVPRPVLTQAAALADPTDRWAALRAVPSGAQLADTWEFRDRALAAYRDVLAAPGHPPSADVEGIDADHVLSSLLHVHYVRARGSDRTGEQVGLHLARAAAKSWTARHGGRR